MAMWLCGYVANVQNLKISKCPDAFRNNVSLLIMYDKLFRKKGFLGTTKVSGILENEKTVPRIFKKMKMLDFRNVEICHKLMGDFFTLSLKYLCDK